MKDWVTEIKDRMKDADNACTVIDYCYHELIRGIEEDVRIIEYSDHIPEDLKARQELLAELEDSIRVCNEWGEACQARWEEGMERDISRIERMR